MWHFSSETRCKTLRAVRFIRQYDDIMESARQRVSARVRTVTELLRRLYASWFYPVLSVSGEARAFRPYVSSPATYGCWKHFWGYRFWPFLPGIVKSFQCRNTIKHEPLSTAKECVAGRVKKGYISFTFADNTRMNKILLAGFLM